MCVFCVFVSNYNLKIVDVKNLSDARREIQDIGSDPASIEIMAPKAISKVIKLENVVLQDAIIIKQDMLSIGGEVAVPRDTFKLNQETGNILIIGNLKQLHDLVGKLKRHYSRIKEIADDLEILLEGVK